MPGTMRVGGKSWATAPVWVALVLSLGACAPPEPVRRAADDAAEGVDQGFDTMREENRRRARQIAESSLEMEEERRRVIEHR